jgi:hypothetical protein
MKKATVMVCILLGGVSLGVPARAGGQQETGQQAVQKVTKTTKTIAALAKVLYKGAPQFVPIEGTSISYATNTPQEVIHIGDDFYLKMQDVWLVSADALGPWTAAPFVPEVVPAIVCGQQNASPYDPSQLCALPWGSGLSYQVWKTS